MPGKILSTSGTLGSSVMGRTRSLGKSVSFFGYYEYADNSLSGIASTALFSAFGSRGALDSDYFSETVYPVQKNLSSVFIKVVSVSGVHEGTFRFDVQRPLVVDVSFTNDQSGCADFQIRLNELPPFPIRAKSNVEIYLFGDSVPWYTGYIEEKPEEGTTEKTLIIKGFGLRKRLSRVRDGATYSTAQDIGALVDAIVQAIVLPNTAIKYNADKINRNTGVLTTGPVELSKHTLDKVFDDLATTAGCFWGVDGEGEFFFRLQDRELKRVFFEGWDFSSMKVSLDKNVVNSVIVRRMNPKGTGKSGFTIAALANDPGSIIENDLQEKVFNVSGYFQTPECQIIANNLLAELKDHKTVIEVRDMPIDDSEDRPVFGKVGFASRFSPSYSEIYDDAEDLSLWGKIGANDLIVSQSSAIVMDRAYSIRLSYTNGTNDVARVRKYFRQRINKVKFWIFSQRPGQIITIGVGVNDWNEKTYPVTVPIAGQFFEVKWDIESENIWEINYFGIRIDDASGFANDIYIDRIELDVRGSKRYDLQLIKATTRITPTKGITLDLTAGASKNRTENFIAGLKTAIDNMDMEGEVR